MKTLVLMEHDGPALRPGSGAAIGFARELSKDITALVLGIVGVPAETIAEDYALSARYLVARHLDSQAALDVSTAEYTWEHYQREFCPPDVMLKMLHHLDERYGGVEAYVRSTGMRPGQIESIRTALVD